MDSLSTSGQTVFSPAGEPVEILSDEDWCDLTGLTMHGVSRPYVAKLRVVQALWHHGEYTSPNGKATALLHPDAVSYGYQGAPNAITGLIADPLNAPMLERKVTGKRTYGIKLIALPHSWYRRLLELESAMTAVEAQRMTELEALIHTPGPEPIPEPSEGDKEAAELVGGMVLPVDTSEPDEPELVVDLPAYVPPPDLLESSPYLEVAPQVAMALLTQVVEIITAGSPEQADQRVRHLTQEVAAIADKLARRLQENDAMRRQLRTLGEELNAVKYERDGLRSRLRQTEHNLKVALKSDIMQQVNERVYKELDRVMRVVPSSSRKTGDPA